MILFSFLVLFSFTSVYAQSSVSRDYLVVDYNGNFYTLNVTVTNSLYQYYVDKSHALVNVYDIDKFVTPQVVKPVADLLKSVSVDDEDFVNQVLKWNRQHKYENDTPTIYPAETLYLGYGDCDVFSILVASVLIAGNVSDIVFLTWKLDKDVYHMNLGVHLPYTPKYYEEGTGTLYYVTYNNKKYYIAECTDQGKDPTEKSYVLGNLPTQLENISVEDVIPVVDYDNSYIEQVYANFVNLEQVSTQIQLFIYHSVEMPILSSILRSVCVSYIYPVTVEGLIDTNVSTVTVTLYYSHDNKQWHYLTEIQATNGTFSYVWNIMPTLYISSGLRDFSYEFLLPQKVYVRAYYSNTFSETVSFTYVPLWLIIFIFAFLISIIRKRR
jgi:hypothetical protein